MEIGQNAYMGPTSALERTAIEPSREDRAHLHVSVQSQDQANCAREQDP